MTPTATLLPLDCWREEFGYHPFHFWQLADRNLLKVTGNCDTVVREYNWQNAQATGRENIRQAIASAEAQLTAFLGFAPASRYVELTAPWPRWHDPSVPRLYPVDPTGRWIGVTLPEGQIQAVGVQVRALLGTPAPVITDSDEDGVLDTFTLTLTVPLGTDPSTVAVYFAAGDRQDGDPVGEAYRIQPVEVSLSGVTLTVVGRCWLIVKPRYYRSFAANPARDPADAGTFVAELEVYASTTSATGTDVGTSQGVMVWETRPWPPALVASLPPYDPAAPHDPAAVGMATARVGIRDAALGIVEPAQSVYDASSGQWSQAIPPYGSEPDRVIVRALAGAARDAGGLPAAPWRTIIARLAAAELARPICACDQANATLYYWQFDLARAAGANDEQYATSAEIVNCPWGTRRGHVWAWKQVLHRRRAIGLLP